MKNNGIDSFYAFAKAYQKRPKKKVYAQIAINLLNASQDVSELVSVS